MTDFDSELDAISRTPVQVCEIILDYCSLTFGAGACTATDPDILNDDCSDIALWTDADLGVGVSEEDPAGQFRFDSNASSGTDDAAGRTMVIISPPDEFTLEIKTYFDSLGTLANSDNATLVYATDDWQLRVLFCSDGLYISKVAGLTTEVGANIVKCNATAAWQTWRFQVDKSAGVAAATVEVFLDNVSQGTVDCDYESGLTDGLIWYYQGGYTTDNMLSHVDYFKVANGLGEFGDLIPPCFNTYRTCRAKTAYVKSTKTYTFCSADARPLPMATGERPYIDKVTYMPTEIKTSLTVNARVTVEFFDEEDTDVGIDPYRSSRSSVQGTFWKKLLARNPNYKGRILKLYDGFVWNDQTVTDKSVQWMDGIEWMDGVEWMTFTYPSGGNQYELRQRFVGTLDNITLNKGKIKVEAVDMLKKLNEITIPEKLNLKVAAGCSATQTQITLSGDGISSLDAAGYIKIDDEIIKYSSKSVTGVLALPADGRGYFSTTAATHNADTKVQKCRYFAPGSGFDHMLTILLTDCAIDAAYVDSTAFTAARDDSAGDDEVYVSAIIHEPEKAEKIFFELVELFNCRAWVGENLKVTIKRNTPNQIGRTYTAVTDSENIVGGSESVDLNQKSKLSRVSFYWDRYAEKKNDETFNFNRLDIAIDAEAESVNEDNYISEKRILSRWLRAGYAQEENVNAFAKTMPTRLRCQSRDALPIHSCTVELKDSEILTGDYVYLSTSQLQDKNGNDYSNVPFMVIRREPREKNKVMLKSQQLSAKKFIIIAPASYDGLDWADATNAQKQYGCICDSNGLKPNGDDGDRIW